MHHVTFSCRSLPLEGLAPPLAGHVHLWFLDLAELSSPILQAEGALSPRQERTTRRFYLRLLLGAYLGVPGKDVRISRMVKGKPVLDAATHGGALDFSSAGSNGSCLIGITSAGQIGVDLEADQRKAHHPRALARRYFSAAEQSALESATDDDLDTWFLHTWACKEAVVKAAGHGIANQLCRFSVEVDPARPAAVLDMEGDQPDTWQLSVVRPQPGFLGAVALRHSSIEIEGFRLLPVARLS
ncbi:MAG: 4'-phosphopantetheinyl transferase superfamily protein [Xanthomonadales bacterium]|nr:4'-phosphopantetheinyl transferase superfamily protein [Xanthomonadales bacterium]NNL94945.1 4'-phosphopantetheinyl transferase superfamily protein [Xanthomonadales bacterium]